MCLGTESNNLFHRTGRQRVPGLNRSHIILIHTQYPYHPPVMSYLTPVTSSLPSTETIRPSAIRSESQPRRYASFCCAYQFVNKHSPRATVHNQRVSTYSTMDPLLIYFISIDRPSSTETKMIRSILLEGRNGTANDGGINSLKFAKDGET